MSIRFRQHREWPVSTVCARFALLKDCLQNSGCSRSVVVCGEGVDCVESSSVWKKDGKDGAAEGSGGAGADAQAAAVLLNQFAGDPQAEACAGIFFCGEEWFEDACDMPGGNAKTGVRDGDANALTR